VVLSWGPEKKKNFGKILPDMDARSGGDFHAFFLVAMGQLDAKGANKWRGNPRSPGWEIDAITR